MPRKKSTALITRDGGGPKGRISITSAGYETIERMSRDGRDLSSIAATLGVGTQTFRDIRKRDVEAVEAVDRGRAALGDEVTDLLLEQARAGSVTAMIWLDKTRRGLREDRPMEGARVIHNTQVNINIPPAMSEQEFQAIIEGTATDALPPDDPGQGET